MSKARQNYMKKSDVLFSKLIRERDRACQNCGSFERLQCAHLISRRYTTIRTDFDNAVALCAGCHWKFTHDPLRWQNWVEERYPGRWGALRAIALAGGKTNWKARHAELKAMVEEWADA